MNQMVCVAAIGLLLSGSVYASDVPMGVSPAYPETYYSHCRPVIYFSEEGSGLRCYCKQRHHNAVITRLTRVGENVIAECFDSGYFYSYLYAGDDRMLHMSKVIPELPPITAKWYNPYNYMRCDP